MPFLLAGAPGLSLFVWRIVTGPHAAFYQNICSKDGRTNSRGTAMATQSSFLQNKIGVIWDFDKDVDSRSHAAPLIRALWCGRGGVLE